MVIVYTASHKSYADSVLDFLDPNKELIKYRLYRHNCVHIKHESESIFVKDLRIFNNVKMENMIIIDNSVLSFAFQIENGIPILPYYDKDDIELKFLSNYLNSIHNAKDLRIENNKSIKMLYFLNTVREKIEGKNIENNNSNNNYSSYESEDKKIYNNNGNFINNNNYSNNFNINLFSAEKNLDSESSYFESDNSNSHILDSEQSILKTSQFENFSSENSNSEYLENNNNNNHCSNSLNNSFNNNNNSNNNSYINYYSNLKDILHDTLDDLRKTFSKYSEEK